MDMSGLIVLILIGAVICIAANFARNVRTGKVKFSIRILFAMVALAALLMLGLLSLPSGTPTHSTVVWVHTHEDLLKLPADQVVELIQLSLPKEQRKSGRELGVIVVNTDGVQIRPLHRSITFEAVGTRWDRQERLDRLDGVVSAWLAAQTKLKIEFFEVKEYMLRGSFRADSTNAEVLSSKKFYDFPMQ